MSCFCGDTACPSCGTAQGTYQKQDEGPAELIRNALQIVLGWLPDLATQPPALGDVHRLHALLQQAEEELGTWYTLDEAAQILLDDGWRPPQ